MIAFPLNGYEPDELPEFLETDTLNSSEYVYFDRNGIILQSSIKYYKLLNSKNYIDEYILPIEDIKNGNSIHNKTLIQGIDRLRELSKGTTKTKIKQEQKNKVAHKEQPNKDKDIEYKKPKRFK